ncbi:hypothetical protein V2I52_24110 [Brenneria sp. g21c3]|uniref:hypothetical protein n=1 Tax=Brenneria sp. g21c3 TaxID=3093893 RepID=UPI002EB192B2|nr:hypothetical protein [Brenneria sp. g21c3]
MQQSIRLASHTIRSFSIAAPGCITVEAMPAANAMAVSSAPGPSSLTAGLLR